MHQHVFSSSVLTDETALGLQFFHDPTKNEGTCGNDFFTGRFQAGYPDSVCFCFAEHIAFEVLNGRQDQRIILNPRRIINA